jgi:hypothetical protein
MEGGVASGPLAEGYVTGRIVGKRRCSKRLAFYDVRELAELSFGTLAAAAAAGAGGGVVTQVELVAKAGTRGFADEAALGAAQKDALKLGNVVRACGTWSVSGEGEWVLVGPSHNIARHNHGSGNAV